MSVIKLSGLSIFRLKTSSAHRPENRRLGTARAKLVTLFLSFLLLCNLAVKLVGDDGPKAQSEPEQMAITGARILTAAGQNYEKGTILIRAGKIVEVGENIKIPEGTRIIEARGCLITPGLIDAHSHLGLGPSGGVTEDNEMSDPVTPQLRIIDSIHPEGLGPTKINF